MRNIGTCGEQIMQEEFCSQESLSAILVTAPGAKIALYVESLGSFSHEIIGGDLTR